MFEVCETGRTKIVELLLKHYNCEDSGLNVSDNQGWTSFTIACSLGHKDIVKLLLDNAGRNIDFNARTKSGSTALIIASRQGHFDF